MTAYVVVGLGYGDEGKGTVVDYLVRARGARTVVRYGGGPQAAHHVVDPDGREHVFSQLPAGFMDPSTRGLLAGTMLLDPVSLLRENRALTAAGFADGLARLTIEPSCPLVTPWQRIVGRMRELARGRRRHGSVGLGVGEAAADTVSLGPLAPRAADLRDPKSLGTKARLVRTLCVDRAEQLVEAHAGCAGLPELLERLRGEGESGEVWVQECLALIEACPGIVGSENAVIRALADCRDRPVVLEGAQGVLLDRDLGFWPHVTKTRSTAAHARELLSRAGLAGVGVVLGVTRAYATRHGPGPFVTESAALFRRLPDRNNRDHPWQGRFRVGWLDIVATRYAIAANGGVDRLAITALDRLDGMPAIRLCVGYRAKPGRSLRSGSGADPDLLRCFCFDRSRRVVTGIGPGPEPSVEHQQRLGLWLRRCAPVWRVLRVGLLAARSGAGAVEVPEAGPRRHHRSLAETIGELLGVPVALVSSGPTWRDKAWISPGGFL